VPRRRDRDASRSDGAVIAQYGRTKVYVNLGNVPRNVGPYALGAYEWKTEEVK